MDASSSSPACCTLRSRRNDVGSFRLNNEIISRSTTACIGETGNNKRSPRKLVLRWMDGLKMWSSEGWKYELFLVSSAPAAADVDDDALVDNHNDRGESEVHRGNYDCWKTMMSNENTIMIMPEAGMRGPHSTPSNVLPFFTWLHPDSSSSLPSFFLLLIIGCYLYPHIGFNSDDGQREERNGWWWAHFFPVQSSQRITWF